MRAASCIVVGQSMYIDRWHNMDMDLVGLFSCLSFINHVIMNAYYIIISFFFLLPTFILVSGLVFRSAFLHYGVHFGPIFHLFRCVFGACNKRKLNEKLFAEYLTSRYISLFFVRSLSLCVWLRKVFVNWK